MNNETKATPIGIRGPLPDYWDRANHLPHEQVELLPRNRTPTRFLTPTERATVRVSAPSFSDIVPGFSLLHEAALRCHVWHVHDVLPYASGHWVARELERAILRSHPIALHHAARGWDLLRQLSAANLGVSITVAAEPAPTDSTQRRPMALHERCAELVHGTPSRA